METTLNITTTIIEFAIAFGALIFLHEFGHFLFAKLNKIEIEEFGFGYPPRLIKMFTLGGTVFSLNLIPFGGFVRPKGENDPNVPGGLAGANPFTRLAVLLGGPIMNLLTGILLFSLIFVQVGVPNETIVQIYGVNDGSPAESAGISPGDIILKVNDENIDSMIRLSNIVQENLGKEISITFERDDEILSTNAVPRINPPDGEGSLGIIMSNPNIPITFFEALPFGVRATYEQGRQLLLMPSRLIQGQIAPEQARIIGPKGIFDLYQQARERDIETASLPPGEAELPAIHTLWMLAVISVAIGLTNLLPIPALDGGRILFILPEIILRRRVPAEYENMVHLIGFFALITILVYVTTQDIINPIILP